MPTSIKPDHVEEAAAGWLRAWCEKCKCAPSMASIAKSAAHYAIRTDPNASEPRLTNIWVITARGLADAAVNYPNDSVERLAAVLALGHLLKNIEVHANVYLHETLFGKAEQDDLALVAVLNIFEVLADSLKGQNAELFSEIRPLQGELNITVRNL